MLEMFDFVFSVTPRSSLMADCRPQSPKMLGINILLCRSGIMMDTGPDNPALEPPGPL